MLFTLFGIAILAAAVVGVILARTAFREKRPGAAVTYIVGLPVLALIVCFLIAVIIFVNTDMNW